MISRNDTLESANGQHPNPNFSTPAAKLKNSALYEYVIAAICRNQDVLTFASERLKPEDLHTATKYHYGIIFYCVQTFHNKYNRLPDRESLSVDVDKGLRNIPNVPDNVVDETFELLDWIFSSETEGIPTDVAKSNVGQLAFHFRIEQLKDDLEMGSIQFDDALEYFANFHQELSDLSQPENDPWAFVDLDSPVDENPNYLIQGVLLDGQPQVLFGNTKCLKSTMILDMAISLVTGDPFLGHFAINKKCKTILMSGESGAETSKRKIKQIWKGKFGRERNPDTDTPLFHFVPRVPHFTDANGVFWRGSK